MVARRADLYTHIHKGLRSTIFTAAQRAGVTDWADASSVQTLTAQVERLLGLLRAHVVHEEQWVHPLIAQKMPGRAADLAAEHHGQEAYLDELETHLRRIKGAPDVEKRCELGLEFYRCLNRFLAHYLLHLDEEESHVMLSLWELCTTSELEKVQQSIIGGLGPEELLLSLEMMLPALEPSAREALLVPMKADTPPSVFRSICALAARVLSPADWTSLKKKIGATD